MPDYEGDIISIIRSGISPKAMKNRLEDYHENDIAEVLPDAYAGGESKAVAYP